MKSSRTLMDDFSLVLFDNLELRVEYHFTSISIFLESKLKHLSFDSSWLTILVSTSATINYSPS